MSNLLLQGRESFQEQNWMDAYTLLSAADREETLSPVDLESLAKASYLVGQEHKCTDSWSRAHHEYLNRDDTGKAAQCAFWLGMIFFNLGDKAQGGGWIARAERLVSSCKKEFVLQGFLLIPAALQCLRVGDTRRAGDLFHQAAEMGSRYKSPDLMALGQLGKGQALIQEHKISEGTALLDEAMVAVVAGEITPIVAGIVYCAVIETCKKIYDLQRAQEWTTALSRWCDSHPEMVPYRGQCLVRRAEIMQLHGRWEQAMDEVKQACEVSPSSIPRATGEAFYRKAELHRLKGNCKEAEESYQQASRHGRNPQPGLALLRLSEGRHNAAKASICQVETKHQDPVSRSRILPAYIEVMLATNNIQLAKKAAGELSDIAAELGASFLEAVAERAKGCVFLAEEEPNAALDKLRRAWHIFNNIKAPYEAARTQILIGLSCQKLGDEDSAVMEFSAAEWTFQQLGANPDLDNLHAIAGRPITEYKHGLTPRELQVLRLIATGITNKSIAEKLFISERTVDRHVSNILGKLDVPSRSAATAYAFEHNLA